MKTSALDHKVLGGVLFIVGLAFIAYVVFVEKGNGAVASTQTIGFLFTVIGLMAYFRWFPRKITKEGLFFSEKQTVVLPPSPPTPQHTLTEGEKAERRRYSDGLKLPGAEAPKFHLLEECLALKPTPSADPMTPMYTLDTQYRIIDWNDTFAGRYQRWTPVRGHLGETQDFHCTRPRLNAGVAGHQAPGNESLITHVRVSIEIMRSDSLAQDWRHQVRDL